MSHENLISLHLSGPGRLKFGVTMMLLVFCTPSSPGSCLHAEQSQYLPVVAVALEGLRITELSPSFYSLGLPFSQQAVVG